MQVPIPVIGRSIANNRVVFFLGAGASIAGLPRRLRVPAGNQLADSMKAMLGALPTGGPSDPTLPEVAMYFEKQAQRANLLGIIYDEFKRSKTARTLPVTQTLIAKIASETGNPQLIITTNYDHYMENCFRREGVDFVSISHITNKSHPQHGDLIVVDSSNQAQYHPTKTLDLNWPKDKSIIYKIHGNLPEPHIATADMVVLTEIDYYNFTDTHMENVPVNIISALNDKDTLYLGYSLYDWNFRLFLYRALSGSANTSNKNLLRSPPSTNQTGNWAISRRFDWVEELFWEKFSVNLYSEDLATIIPDLASEIGISI